MSFPTDFHKFLSDIKTLDVPALSNFRGQISLQIGQFNRVRGGMPAIVVREMASRLSLYKDAVDDELAYRWLSLAPSVRINRDGSLRCERHKEKALAFFLGEPCGF
jgi:hypothetical protein